MLLSEGIQYPYDKTSKLIDMLPVPSVYLLKMSKLSKSTTLATSDCDINLKTMVALCAISSKMFVFSRNMLNVARFDLERGEWSLKVEEGLVIVENTCIFMTYFCLKFHYF